MARNCLEYGITVNNDSVNTGIDKRNRNADVHGEHGSASLTIWRLKPFAPEAESILKCRRIIFVVKYYAHIYWKRSTA